MVVKQDKNSNFSHMFTYVSKNETHGGIFLSERNRNILVLVVGLN